MCRYLDEMGVEDIRLHLNQLGKARNSTSAERKQLVSAAVASLELCEYQQLPFCN